jgi:predicted transcriptional regulator
MNTYDIPRIVIVKHNHPIGIVTLKDFLPSSIFYSPEFFENGEQISRISPKGIAPKFIPTGPRSFLIVQDIMNTKLLLMDRDDDMAESAKVMIRHRISGLPVIDIKSDLVGVITKTDILKAILKIPKQAC